MKNKSKNNLRRIIREVFLHEFNMGMGASGWDSNNDITMFHGYPSGVQKFPYGDTDLPENLSNINKQKHNLDSYYDDKSTSYNKLARNQDVYKFPFKEFKIGLDIESHDAKRYDEHINIIDIAIMVLKKLSSDPQYYSKFTEN